MLTPMCMERPLAFWDCRNASKSAVVTMMNRMVQSVVGNPKMAQEVPSSTSRQTHTIVAVGSLQFSAVCHLHDDANTQLGPCLHTFLRFKSHACSTCAVCGIHQLRVQLARMHLSKKHAMSSRPLENRKHTCRSLSYFPFTWHSRKCVH